MLSIFSNTCKLGKDKNDQDDNARTCLHHADLGKMRGEAVQPMKDGATCNIQDNEGDTPLHDAVSELETEEDIKLVLEMLEQGASCNVQDKEGRIPLHVLLKEYTHQHESILGVNTCNFVEVIKAMLSHGVDCNIKDADGCTPLHLAVKSGNGLELATLLVASRADPTVVDKKGKSVLHHVAANSDFRVNRKEIVHYLVQQGSDLTKQDDQGNTALHGMFEREAVLEQLEHGANINHSELL